MFFFFIYFFIFDNFLFYFQLEIDLLLSMFNIQETSLKELGSCKQQQQINEDFLHTPLETTRRDASQFFSNENYVSQFFRA